jgi:uncharacterized delta-60 repeat protein
MKKIILFSSLIISLAIHSQTLDPTYGSDGVVTHQISSTNSKDIAYSAAMQPDGKIVYVGRDFNNTFAFVARANTTGQLDGTFNNYGYRKFNFTGYDVVTIQPNGKIVVAGLNNIIRLNSDGSYDTTFNNTGALVVTINSQNFISKNIIAQANGKILVSGYVNTGLNNDFAILRLNSNGTFDTSFDTDGIATFVLGNNNDESFGMAVQVDGKIILTGQTYNGTNYDFATIRLNNNGTIDGSFANNGVAIVQFSGQDYGRSVDIQADGKIVVVGSGTVGKLYVLRYNIDGNLDTTFDGDGILASTIAMATSTSIGSITLSKPKIKSLSNGKTLISGSSSGDFSLIQLNANGSMDTTFGTNGMVTYSGLNFDYTNFLFINANNKIITGGSSYDGTSLYRIEQLQFSASGVFESEKNYNLLSGSDTITRMFEQSNGKIIALFDSNEGSTIRRLNTDGSLDGTFGVNGVAENIFTNLYKIKQQNGMIVACSTDTAIIYRWTSEGLADTTFGTGGFVDLHTNALNYVSFVDEICIDPGGDFIYVGFDYDQSVDTPGVYNGKYGLLRLNYNGFIDTNFGVNGYASVRFDYYGIDSNEWPSEIGIQSNGKIVVSGFLNTVSGTEDYVMGITRFNNNGTVDTTFGNSNGKTVSIIGTKNYPRQLFILSDDKILINTSTTFNTIFQTATAKFNSNGTNDLTFGSDGVVIDTNNNLDMILQPDGKIIKAGQVGSYFGIKRYTSTGTIDSTFGNTGVITTPLGFNSLIHDILLLPSNKLLAGGLSFNGTRNLATLARYTSLALGNLDFSNETNSFLIYPNPIETDATFEYNLQNDETITIDIIDLQGKIVKSILSNQNQTTGNYKQKIDLSNSISAGNYILKFSSLVGSQSIQIIKK